jgi:hypothetical protein
MKGLAEMHRPFRADGEGWAPGPGDESPGYSNFRPLGARLGGVFQGVF